MEGGFTLPPSRRTSSHPGSRLLTLILILGVSYAVALFCDQVLKGYRLNQRIEAAQVELARRQQENQLLQSRLQYVRSDDYVVVAAHEMGYAWPDEKVIIPVAMPASPAAGQTAPSHTVTPATQMPASTGLDRWFNLFFGVRSP